MATTDDASGTVAALWRHPVKSMLGERVDEVALDQRGVVGDRRWALVDVETGRVASAKRPRRWGALLACRSTLDGDRVRIALPDGSVVRSGERRCDDKLSALAGRRVMLVDRPPEGAAHEKEVPDVEGLLPQAAGTHTGDDGETLVEGRLALGSPPGTFVDFAPVHLVTVQSLSRLGALQHGGAVPAPRFRPNVVLDLADAGEEPWPELGWMGRTLTIGEATLRVMIPTPRCAVPALAHGDIPADDRLLRTVADNARVPVADLGPHGCVGVYASVVRPGPVKIGDPVVVG